MLYFACRTANSVTTLQLVACTVVLDLKH